ncbi:hypothetical protein AVEN_133743-1 [Araneus ventricosus]|uniref:Uncharacterized protein n=1 Tax=Araneus ventricosus TaxID=182803 RepID=A0A4Y2B8J6_ARAVE|nr:hypothetical protein AVEN_133743-1 [Araneus ventricosus]
MTRTTPELASLLQTSALHQQLLPFYCRLTTRCLWHIVRDSVLRQCPDQSNQYWKLCPDQSNQYWKLCPVHTKPVLEVMSRPEQTVLESVFFHFMQTNFNCDLVAKAAMNRSPTLAKREAISSSAGERA